VDEQFRIRKEIGIESEPLFFGGQGYNLTRTGNKDMSTDEETIETIRWHAREVLAITDEHGIEDVYVYGIDEAKGEQLLRQRAIWDIIHREGLRIFVAGYVGAAARMGDILDMHICGFGVFPEEAAIMHSHGNKIMSYANPQSGPENPELFRRNFGLLLWKANFDGAATYKYNTSFGHPWNDFDHPRYRDHNFTYQTVDGVINTIAWEGYREGVDDIRYGTTLQLEIRRARDSGDPERRDIAISAERYLQELDASRSDLSLNRLEMTNFILKLKGS